MKEFGWIHVNTRGAVLTQGSLKEGTEKKDGAKTVPFGNCFEKWFPFRQKGTKTLIYTIFIYLLRFIHGTVPFWQSAPQPKGHRFPKQCP